MLQLGLTKYDDESTVSTAHWAVRSGKKRFVSALVAAGVPLDTVSERGESLLRVAAARNQVEIASVDFASKKRWTAVHRCFLGLV